MWTRFGRGKVWRHAHVQDFPGELLDLLVKEAGLRVIGDSAFMLGMLRARKIAPTQVLRGRQGQRLAGLCPRGAADAQADDGDKSLNDNP